MGEDFPFAISACEPGTAGFFMSSEAEQSAAKVSAERTTAKQASTREKLIETARQLFLAKGYEATGVAEILREAGVNSGSLYYFFKTKEDLLVAVLDQYVELLYPYVMDPVFAQTDDPIERVFGVLEGYKMMLEMTECRQGCPIGNLALEMSEKSEAVRSRIAMNFENWRKAIRGCLDDAKDRFVEGVDTDKLSTLILTAMEGGVMQARAHRSLKPYEDSIALLRDYIVRLLKLDAKAGEGK